MKKKIVKSSFNSCISTDPETKEMSIACKKLWLIMLISAQRDYLKLRGSEIPNEQQEWESARDFLFDRDYESDLGLSLDILIDWLSSSEKPNKDAIRARIWAALRKAEEDEEFLSSYLISLDTLEKQISEGTL